MQRFASEIDFFRCQPRYTEVNIHERLVVSEIWLGKVIRIPVVATYTNDLLVSVTADPGFPGLWGVPSQVSRLSAAPGSPSDQHQPGSTQPLWTRQPGAASGAGAGTGDWGHFRASSRFRFRVRVRFRKRGSSRVELRSCVRLWFRGMYGGWGRASGWNSGIFPGSRNPKEDVPPRTTDTSGLKDTTETQLRPRGELRKRWRGEEGGMEGGIQRMWEMFYPAVSAVPAVPRGTLAIKKHLLNLPPKPFRHPATVYSSFHLWPRGRTHSSQRAKPGKGHTNGWGLSLSLLHKSLPPPRKNLELSGLHNSTTFNQNHKQSREELCHLMNTVQVNTNWSEALCCPLRMTHLHTHT